MGRHSAFGCRELQDQLMRQAEGLALEPAQLELRQRHLQQCEDCRVFVETLSLLPLDSGLPNQPLDQLTRRRAVDAVLAEHAAGQTDGRARRPTRAVAWALAAAALALGLGVVLWRAGPWRDGRSGPRVAVQADQGRLLLQAGEISLERAAPPAFTPLLAGQTIAVGQTGSAVVRLGRKVSLLLAGDTRLRLDRLDRDRIGVSLLGGSLLAAVEPRRPGRFVVETRAATVEVLGTVFSLTADGGRSDLEVLRGKVRARVRRSRRAQTVGEARALDIGRGRPRPIGRRRLARSQRRLRALQLVTADRTGRMTVITHPPGARVVVDGLPLGRTPLHTRLDVGRRTLRVELRGHAPLQEYLTITAGRDSRREFALRPAGSQVAAMPDAAARGSDSAAGEPASAPAPGTAARRPSVRQPRAPKELLAVAQKLRAQKQWRRAAAAYRRVIDSSSPSPEARIARVSLGYIELEHLGRPKRALIQFSRYLIGGKGTLSREAALGRIDALRALGRTAEEIDALRQFIARYPRSVHRARLARRLRQLGGTWQEVRP